MSHMARVGSSTRCGSGAVPRAAWARPIRELLPRSSLWGHVDQPVRSSCKDAVTHDALLAARAPTVLRHCALTTAAKSLFSVFCRPAR